VAISVDCAPIEGTPKAAAIAPQSNSLFFILIKLILKDRKFPGNFLPLGREKSNLRVEQLMKNRILLLIMLAVLLPVGVWAGSLSL
jgi:hypothetical protein